MGTKVEELMAAYSATFEKHLNALDSGLQRSLNGNYGAEDWFEDVAKAGRRAEALLKTSWEIAFPTARRLTLRVDQGTAAVSEVFSIDDPNPTVIPAVLTLVRGMDSINANVRVVGKDREKLVVDIAGDLARKPATTTTPYAIEVKDAATNTVTLFRLELHIVAP